MPKSAKFQNNDKNDSPSGACAPPEGTIFLSEILILGSSIYHISLWLKKLNGFLIGKKFNFSKQQG